MADTRKDKRAPISLKVRFKSATLDEFIEQYSVDISRGGIFIKSKTPMSIGTLLKFEFRLKDESRLIHGVGRVVWKREDEGADKPPGMGIKFIKMDPESRALVEQMVAKRGEAPGRFEEGQESEEPAAPAAAAPFFPSTTPESELPAPEDRTQVRHASEFLASALAEGDAKSASKEAEKKAEEARKRTEEIEKQRAEAKRKPRIKKTLVGVGIPEEATKSEPPALEQEPVAVAKGARDDEAEATESDRPEAIESDRPAAKLSDLDVSESAETKALDRAALEEAEDDEETVEAAPEPQKVEAEAEADEVEEVEARKPEPEKKADEKKAEPKADKPAAKKEEAKAEPTPKPRPKVEEAPAVAQASAPDEGGSKNGMIFFGVVAAAAIGLVVYFQMQPQGGDTNEGGDQPIATQPTGDETPPDVDPLEDPAADPEGLAVEDAVEPIEDPEPAVPTTSVRVVTAPEGATVLVNGAEQGTAPLEVQLPIGQAATVAARLTGYTEASQEVTASENQAPVRLTLQQMPYVIHVVTQPAGARVRSSAGTVTAPGDLTLRRPPTGPVALTAQLRGHEDGSLSVQVGDFAESEGRMVATVTLTLTERAAPVRTPPEGGGGRRPAGGGEEAGGGEAAGGGARPAGGGARPAGGGARPAGGGETGGGAARPAGGGETGGGEAGGGSRPAGGGETGGGSEPAGGGETGGGGGEEPAPPPPPDNPFG